MTHFELGVLIFAGWGLGFGMGTLAGIRYALHLQNKKRLAECKAVYSSEIKERLKNLKRF
jgi:hypothetical protein